MTKIDIRKGEPLKLPNGDVVLPASETGNGKTDVKSANTLQIEEEMRKILGDPFEEVQFHRTLADINVPFNNFTTTITVVAMTMWGLDKYAISRIVNIDPDMVDQIMQHQLFAELRKQMVEALRYAEMGTVHGYLQQKALTAAATVTTSMMSKDKDLALKAAQDVLDRTGFRPVDRVEHSHRFEDDLRIVHLTEQTIPTLDIKLVDN